MNRANYNYTPSANGSGYSNYSSYSGSASSAGTSKHTFKDFESQWKNEYAFCNAELHLYDAFDSTKGVDIVQFREWLKPLSPTQLGKLNAKVSNLFELHRGQLTSCEREVHLAGAKLPARSKTAAKCSGVAFAILGSLQFEQVAALLFITPPALLPFSIAIVAVAATYICGPFAQSQYSCKKAKGALSGVQEKVNNLFACINEELGNKFKKPGQKQLPPGQVNNTVPESAAAGTSRAPNTRATPAPAPMQPTFVTEPEEAESPAQTADERADLTEKRLNSMKDKLQAQADEIAFLWAELNSFSHQVGGAAL